MANVIVCESAREAGLRAAQVVIETVRNKPASVLGLATGRSPIGIYAELVRACAAGEVSFRDAVAVNLDEYVGLGAAHPGSFAAFMQRELFAGCDFAPERVHIPDGTAADMEAALASYDRRLDEIGQRDLQVLGIGTNGHIGFNEPGASLSARTHLVRLAEQTRLANASDFDALESVPTQAITMGVGDILQAKHIVFIALGEPKAEIMKRALSGTVTTDCPGSLLQLHPNVSIFLDPEAASKLPIQ